MVFNINSFDMWILQTYLAQTRRQRIQELLEKQEKLKVELADAKRILMVDPTTWSYDRKRCFRCFTLDVLITTISCLFLSLIYFNCLLTVMSYHMGQKEWRSLF